MVIVDGDPLAEISDLGNVTVVIQAGGSYSIRNGFS